MPDKSKEQLTRPDIPALNQEQQERLRNIRRIASIGALQYRALAQELMNHAG
jgi:hypothetical protein